MTKPRSPEEQQRLHTLQQQMPVGINYDFDSLFPKLKGFGSKRLLKKKMTWIQNTAPLLKECLEDGEIVRSVTYGIVNYMWELMFMGGSAALVNTTMVVLTDRRILMIHSDNKGNPKSFLNQVLLTNVTKIGGGWLKSLTLKTGSQKKQMGAIPKSDQKVFTELQLKSSQSQGGSFQFLCPSCFHVYDKRIETCNRCRTQMKSAQTATLRSLVFPGLGDWYLGHKFLAFFEMIGSTFLWGFFFILLATGFEENDSMEELFGVAVVIAVVNIMDALLTRAQAHKGMMSTSGKLPHARTD